MADGGLPDDELSDQRDRQVTNQDASSAGPSEHESDPDQTESEHSRGRVRHPRQRPQGQLDIPGGPPSTIGQPRAPASTPQASQGEALVMTTRNGPSSQSVAQSPHSSPSDCSPERHSAELEQGPSFARPSLWSPSPGSRRKVSGSFSGSDQGQVESIPSDSSLHSSADTPARHKRPRLWVAVSGRPDESLDDTPSRLHRHQYWLESAGVTSGSSHTRPPLIHRPASTFSAANSQPPEQPSRTNLLEQQPQTPHPGTRTDFVWPGETPNLDAERERSLSADPVLPAGYSRLTPSSPNPMSPGGSPTGEDTCEYFGVGQGQQPDHTSAALTVPQPAEVTEAESSPQDTGNGWISTDPTLTVGGATIPGHAAVVPAGSGLIQTSATVHSFIHGGNAGDAGGTGSEPVRTSHLQSQPSGLSEDSLSPVPTGGLGGQQEAPAQQETQTQEAPQTEQSPSMEEETLTRQPPTMPNQTEVPDITQPSPQLPPVPPTTPQPKYLALFQQAVQAQQCAGGQTDQQPGQPSGQQTGPGSGQVPTGQRTQLQLEGQAQGQWRSQGLLGAMKFCFCPCLYLRHRPHQ